MEKLILLFLIALLIVGLAEAKYMYELEPINDIYIRNSSFGTRGNIYVEFNYSAILDDLNKTKEVPVSNVSLGLYFYDVGKTWNNMPMYARIMDDGSDPTSPYSSWNESWSASDYNNYRGFISADIISRTTVTNNVLKYYYWNASGRLGLGQAGTMGFLSSQRPRHTFYWPWSASDYNADTVYNNDMLWGEDNSGKDAIAYSKNNLTHPPKLFIHTTSCIYDPLFHDGDMYINCSENCVFDYTLDLSQNNLYIRGNGTVIFNQPVINFTKMQITGSGSDRKCEVYMYG